MVCATVDQSSSSFVDSGESPNPYDRFSLFLPSSKTTSKNGSSPDPKIIAGRWCDWFMMEGRAATEIRAHDVVDAGELAIRAASQRPSPNVGPTMIRTTPTM
ncbi:hypothetical protein TIFTF001_031066 [Ficus carica]|uniref:Uncharacterized protein n=1 Tax=Ficus carica TaxID=3494 RepID=A0AA88J5U3_FICCA|nr:hypothetical protein TIFTF001_031066 [Ficus carica]